MPNMPFRDCLEALPALPQAALWDVNQEILTRHAGYAPPIDPTLYEELIQLRADVRLLTETAASLVRFVREMGLHTQALRRWVLDKEPMLQEKRAAFGLFAIRHFGLIELMAEIPPSGEAVDTEAARETYNCKRLVRVSTMILTEASTVDRLLRLTTARMLGYRDDQQRLQAGAATAQDVRRAMVQQRYQDAAALARLVPEMTVRARQALAWHQQRYDALEACPAKRLRLRAILGRFVTEAQQAMFTYATAGTRPSETE